MTGAAHHLKQQRWLGTLAAKAYRRWAIGRQVMGVEPVLDLAWKAVRRQRYCLLVTQGQVRASARVLEPLLPDDETRFNGPILLGTDPASRKVLELTADENCLVVFQDDRRRSCVVLECRARILDHSADGSAGRPAFRTFWEAFWPKGPGEDFVQLECTVTALEIWNGLAVVAPDPLGRRSTRLERGPQGAWRAP